MSSEIYPFGISDKAKLKAEGDPSIFNKDGTPHFVDFSPRVTPQPAQPTQPSVAADPKEESAPEPASSKGDATQSDPSSETPVEPPKQPALPGATGGTTPSKDKGSSKPTG